MTPAAMVAALRRMSGQLEMTVFSRTLPPINPFNSFGTHLEHHGHLPEPVDICFRDVRLEAMLEQFRKDNVVVVAKLDYLARSTAELLRITEILNAQSAGTQCSSDP